MPPLCSAAAPNTTTTHHPFLSMASSSRTDASIVAFAHLHPKSSPFSPDPLSDLLPLDPPSPHFLPSPPLDLSLDCENAASLSIDEVAQLVLRRDHRPPPAPLPHSSPDHDWGFRHDHHNDDAQLLLDAGGGLQHLDYQSHLAGPSPTSSSFLLPDCPNANSINGSLVMQMMRSYSSGDLDMLLMKPASRTGSGISTWIESLMKMEEEVAIDVEDISMYAGGGDADASHLPPAPDASTSSAASEDCAAIRYDGGGCSGEASGAGAFIEDEDGDDTGGGCEALCMNLTMSDADDDDDDVANFHDTCFDSNAMVDMMAAHRHDHHIDLGQPTVDEKLPKLVPYNMKAAAPEKMTTAAATSTAAPPPALGEGSMIATVGTVAQSGRQTTHPSAAPSPFSAQQQQQVSPQGVQLMQMLLECAKNVECRNTERAMALLPKLRFQSSRHGDPIQRLTAFFTEALSCRVARLTDGAIGAPPPSLASLDSMTSPYDISVAFAALNDACPYFTFAHLTANQPIIELLSAARHRRQRWRSALRLHIVDFGITHGAQWAALLQAIAVDNLHHSQQMRSSPSTSDHERGGGGRSRNIRAAAAVKVMITGVASPELGERWREALAATGRRLEEFGASLGVDVEFAAAPVPLGDEQLRVEMLRSVGLKRYHSQEEEEEEEEAYAEEDAAAKVEEEIVVANFMLQLSNVLEKGGAERTLAVAAALRPEVATLAEFDADLNEAGWERRFVASLHFFSAMFDSLEASMARDSAHRLCMERSMLGERIVSMVGGAEEGPRRRLQCFSQWQRQMAAAGFRAAPLSSYAAHQARILLLRFSFCRSFTLTEHMGALSLGWLHKPLLSISSWTLL